MKKQKMYLAISIFCLVMYFLLFCANLIDGLEVINYEEQIHVIFGLSLILFFLLGIGLTSYLLKKGEEAILKKVKIILNLFYLPIVLGLIYASLIPLLERSSDYLGREIIQSIPYLILLILMLLLIWINFSYSRTWSYTKSYLALIYHSFMILICTFLLAILSFGIQT